ncbi:MAG: hypothetical protein IKB14_06395, partial [Rikenellaceae bacterium]|nr:hypothetical protein [Rikenellaceae bacterium]
QDFDSVTKETHLRGLRGSPKASPRRCVKIEDFAKYISNANVDSSKSTHAVAPAIENRAAPRHRVRFSPPTKRLRKISKTRPSAC